jgi:hypothetical protein
MEDVMKLKWLTELVERITLFNVSGLETFFEPVHALFRGTMREGIWYHSAL